MSVVMLLVVRDDADVVDAQIAFHLSVGVDFVLVSDHDSTDGTADILESYERDGVLRRISQTGHPQDASWRDAMARLAVQDHGASWIVDAQVDEFWMPRAEGIKEVLGAMPERYGIVQGLVRVFPPSSADEQPFAEGMKLRRPLLNLSTDESTGRLDWALRPLHRVADDMTVVGTREAILDGRVPLRAWYPIEVLRFPIRSREQAERKRSGRSGSVEPLSRIEQDVRELGWSGVASDYVDVDVERHLADGSLVEDVRLRDVLRRLSTLDSSDTGGGRRFSPAAGGRLELATPTVVDDVRYAAECAAVREVDFEPLQNRIAELEQRIASLETGAWTRVRRRLAPLVRR
jgi:hypothetical protein